MLSLPIPPYKYPAFSYVAKLAYYLNSGFHFASEINYVHLMFIIVYVSYLMIVFLVSPPTYEGSFSLDY